MARAKKNQPTITHAEILALAGGSLQKEILKMNQEIADFETKATASGHSELVADFRDSMNRQIDYCMTKLIAVETMYRFEVGEELGYIAEITEED